MPPRPPRQAGFTLVELLITLALMAILLLLAVGPLDNFMHRGKTEGIARQISSLILRARFEALQRNVPARVLADGPNRRIFAYVEMGGDGDFDAGVDRELGRYELPAGVSFRAYAGGENDDNAMWNMLGPAGAQWVEFDGTGVVVEAPDAVPDMLPAIRLADTRENYIEVKLRARETGSVQLRKWDDGAPADAYGTKYVTQGQNGRSWEWL
ncbi:MAG TPA: prepilin-type N-terminal cleavage/methylation domain-containing protein [Thermoanaerobaculia bacterium]|nr:prepilin-type N-terminal cleavage/methylation domain-containing protein [Thermoanaerobaculia bacterium]